MNKVFFLMCAVGILLACGHTTLGQTTEFTYQGRLLSAGVPANGSHDFEFKLFDDAAAGAQLGPTVTLSAVNVNNGVFSVRLDFGNQFPGANRFLEISVRQSGDPSFTVLTPRQAITSAPYSIKSLNAENAANTTQLGGVTASQYVQTTDSRLSDARNPLPNSPSYIQNGTTQQPSSNFNISGTGFADVFNARTQYNLGGERVLGLVNSNSFVGKGTGFFNSSGINNSFVGNDAGFFNTTGSDNTFIGHRAGTANTTAGANTFVGSFAGSSNATALRNSFFGFFAGRDNTTGEDNTFIGSNSGVANTTAGKNTFAGSFAGRANTSGSQNSFFGANAGAANTTGSFNSFLGGEAGADNTAGSLNSYFGNRAGTSNTSGAANSFFGRASGEVNTLGNSNSFFGRGAGGSNSTGSNNSFLGVFAGANNTGGNGNTSIGYFADLGAPNLINATAIGANAFVSGNNSLVLGSINGVNGATADTNVGIGTTAPTQRLHIRTNGGNILFGGAGCNSGFSGIGFGVTLSGCANYSILGNGTDTIVNRPAGGRLSFREGNTDQITIAPGGNVGIGTTTPSERLAVAGTVAAGNVLVSNAVSAFSMGATAVYVLGYGAGGQTTICLNTSKQISLCNSSIRYKTQLTPFSLGLNLVNRLRPVSFSWKSNGIRDIGLIAEDVEKIEPLLVIRNDKGEVEGVKYDRLGVVLTNAVKEQQSQIESQQKAIAAQQAQIQRQQQHIDALKKLVCRSNPQAATCKQK